MRYKTIWFLSCLFVLSIASPVRADDPTSTFVSLAPIPSAVTPSSTSVAVQFEVWDQLTAGTMIFSEAHTVDTRDDSTITNDTGFADLLLGRPTGLNPANFPAGSSRYLDVTVGGTSQLSARIPLYAAPFSLNPGPQGPKGDKGDTGAQGPPGVVQTVTSADTSISVAGTPQDRTVAVANGGITNAHVADGALSPAKIAGTAATLGLNTFTGPQLINNLSGFTGLASTGETGVSGATTSSTPDGTGVLGLGGPLGTGVRGSGSTGVFGIGSTGVSGLSSSLTGTGVSGSGPTGVSGSGSTGVLGTSSALNGVGVSGKGNTGVLGTSSTNETGVSGQGGSLGTGVRGSGNIGVSGTSLNGSGVEGISTGGTGVFGSGGMAAGFFSGNVRVTGNLQKGSGSFKIDHPLDPANKYLSHSFVESPDMMNIYNGVVALDRKGEAWINLPNWFEALNRDFRYQLTAIGAPAPKLYIAQEVSDRRFKIAGGRPDGKVSWQITGIRQDPYAEKHRIVVEEEKPAVEQGYYLHPELYGQPESRGIAALVRTPAPLPAKTSAEKAWNHGWTQMNPVTNHK